jgi:Sulfotransferase domain
MLTVIGAGLPRTGTISLKKALERLGFGPCYHMIEMMQHPDHAARWQGVIDGEPADWDQLFAGYGSAVDWPAAYFWRELAAAYPSAKFVLGVRDPRRWYVSITEAFLRRFSSGAADPAPVPEPLVPVLPLLHRIREDTLGGPGLPSEDEAVEAFERHVSEVQSTLPPERLLTFEASQGWGPLCDFLGVRPPAGEPYPRLNETATTQRWVRTWQTQEHNTRASGRHT